MAAAKQIKELGEKLQAVASALADELTELLEKAVECLHGIEQSLGPSMMEAIQPSLEAVTREELLKHEDDNVKVLLASCLCEITRITAPVAPYNDGILRDIFYLIVGTLGGLSDVNSQSFGRRVAILEMVAECRTCVLMLDLECDDLITNMFQTFLGVVSDSHEEKIVKLMQTIMIRIIDESYDVEESLLRVLLSALGQKKTGVAMSARKLARSVIEHSAAKLEPYIKKFLTSSWAGNDSSPNDQIDHQGIVFDLYQCAPKVLKVIVPYITGELLADEVDSRSKSVELLGEIFSLPGAPIVECFKTLFAEFLKRLTDSVVEIRISVVEYLKRCLISNPSRAEAPEIIKALCDRLLDYDENVRKGVVAALCDVANHCPDAIPVDTIKVVAERVRDKSLAVKCYAMERLADIYKLYCQMDSDDFEWIPEKILRCLYDKDFRHISVLGDNIDLYQCVPKAERSGKRKKENVMEGIVILGDNIEKIIKVQQDQKVECEKFTEAQIHISNANLKAAKEQKEAKMFEVYNSLIIQDTTHMSKDQKANRDRALRKLEEKLFAA